MSLRVNEFNASLYYMHIRITDCLFLVFMEGVLKRGLHLQPSDQWQGDLITVMLNLHRMMQIKPLPGLWETHLCFFVSALLIWPSLCTHLLLNCCWNFPKRSGRWGADKCQWIHAYFNFLERWSMSLFSMWKYFLLSHVEREFCYNL